MHPDLLDLLAAFADHHVEYVMLGGYAMAVHGLQRATGDLDLLLRTGPANADRVMEALDAYGCPPHIQRANFLVADGVPPTGIWFGREPLRIDLLTSVQGISWEEASANVVSTEIDGVPIAVISAEALLKNKRAVARAKDLVDIEHLERRLLEPR